MKTRLKSGILYYVVFILFIIWIICLGILLAFKLNSFVYIHNALTDNLNSDLHSAINIVCKNPGLINNKDSVSIDFFKDSLSKIKFTGKNWGIFQTLKINVFRKRENLSETFLMGTDINAKEPISLYMADEKKYLSICGNTHLAGNCYLPELGIKRGYVEGNTYRGSTMVFGVTKTSKPELPEVNKFVIGYLKSVLKEFKPDSTIQIRNIKEFFYRDKHYNSFNKPTIAYVSFKPILVDEKIIKGNFIICSSKLIKVTKNCLLSDLLLFAPKIIIADDFQGQVQVFATDTIIVGKKCNLQFPSVIGLVNENVNNIVLRIGEKTRVDGVVLLWQQTKAQLRPELTLGKETEIFGQVYCNGTVKMYGNIFGSLYCRNFMLETLSAIYENHLLNTQIDRTKLPEHFLGLSIADSGKNQVGVIKILR